MMREYHDTLKQQIFEAYNGYCVMPGCYEKAEHLHHMLPQNKDNRKLYPNYIHSPFNLVPMCSTCHIKKPLPVKPTYKQAELYEKWLSDLINDKINEND